jgi:hypothetical protein
MCSTASRLSFDAEPAPDLLATLFTDIQIEPWDAPLLELPTQAAVRDYLIGKASTRRLPPLPRTVSRFLWR